ncbi:ABC transporter substrate-binding protein [Alteribacillus iranensis]|uniref:Amino acid/amide ABC transporter substrate-binding protein, HAAT family n=1 Tax=Alteribacillus iranensis TaxID=930128 RepID=A0A1I2EKZ6_9BACI|nr:ABC transporter substrate-binding protein [Alteribacillus iranensis]SFE93108.1 amino acid/amide ABC transporter substrate-binding protein, HAAT family [Alteribacillus iranensis]
MKSKAIFLTLFIWAFLIGCSSQQGSDEEASAGEKDGDEIRIGALFPLTGSLALLGNESYDGIKLVADVVNENGGINGKQISLVKADAPDATAAQSEANRLISQEKVPLIMGTYSSGLSIAATQVAERNGTIYVESNAVSDEITERGFENIFRVTESASMQGDAAVSFTNEYLAPDFGVKVDELTAVIMHEESSFGTAVATSIEEKAENLGIELLSIDSYNSETNDLSSTIHKYKELKPDIVFATSYINDAILFIQQSKQLNFKPKAIVTTSGGYALSDFGEALGEDSNGIYVADAPSNPNEEALTEEAIKLKEQFTERWKEEHGTELTGQTWRVINAALVMFTEVLPNAESLDADGIRNALSQVDIPLGELPNGSGVKFNEIDGQPGQNSRAEIVMMQWQNEDLNLVWPGDFATEKADNSLLFSK